MHTNSQQDQRGFPPPGLVQPGLVIKAPTNPGFHGRPFSFEDKLCALLVQDAQNRGLKRFISVCTLQLIKLAPPAGLVSFLKGLDRKRHTLG